MKLYSTIRNPKNIWFVTLILNHLHIQISFLREHLSKVLSHLISDLVAGCRVDMWTNPSIGLHSGSLGLQPVIFSLFWHAGHQKHLLCHCQGKSKLLRSTKISLCCFLFVDHVYCICVTYFSEGRSPMFVDVCICVTGSRGCHSVDECLKKCIL